jgi:aryl-phospho-beta-D-glucosidase BglC (GH1 family)
VAGKKLYVRVRIKNQKLTNPASSSQGIKLAFIASTPSGEQTFQCPITASEFDWRTVGFTTVIPATARSCNFVMGLDGVRGTVYFDNLEILTPTVDSIEPESQQSTTITPTLRGAMIPTFITAEDLRVLRSWGANHVRWQLTWGGFPQSPADTASLATYRSWLRNATSHVLSLLPVCDSLQLKVLIDLHTLPGGSRYENGSLAEHRIFTSPAIQKEFRDIWTELASSFRDKPAIWGYDLANEPVEGLITDSVMDWQSLIQTTASDIRAIDSTHTIVVAGSPSGGVPALPSLRPLRGIKNTAYSFHIYDPIQFTHQGVISPDTTIRYPGIIGGRYWDIDTLRAWMEPVREWQLKNDSRIYVGEFSAIRWAPDSSAYRYIRDCISIFESWHWSWAYHAFREWDGWSVEKGPIKDDHSVSAFPTDRLLLLQEAFRRNQPVH